jgi:hypothetical protein
MNNAVQDYSTLSVEGKVHEPMFTIRVVVQLAGKSLHAVATAPNKKLAKHRAANEMLKKIIRSDDRDSFPRHFDRVRDQWVPDAYEVKNESPVLTVDKTSVEFNPVGKLGEYCGKLKLVAPDYQEGDPDISETMSSFVISCKLYGVGEKQETLTSTGKGSRKQLAKKEAAAAMYRQLQELDLIGDTFTRKKGEDDAADALKTANDICDVDEQYERYKRAFVSLKDHMAKLPSISPRTLSNAADIKDDKLSVIAALAEQYNLVATYEMLSQKQGCHEGDEVLNQSRCFLSMYSKNSREIVPIKTYWGAGDDELKAKNDAAARALRFLSVEMNVRA